MAKCTVTWQKERPFELKSRRTPTERRDRDEHIKQGQQANKAPPRMLINPQQVMCFPVMKCLAVAPPHSPKYYGRTEGVGCDLTECVGLLSAHMAHRDSVYEPCSFSKYTNVLQSGRSCCKEPPDAQKPNNRAEFGSEDQPSFTGIRSAISSRPMATAAPCQQGDNFLMMSPYHSDWRPVVRPVRLMVKPADLLCAQSTEHQWLYLALGPLLGNRANPL
ncbi:hypothetical protein PAMP_008942 [Pampus punctatissimus]